MTIIWHGQGCFRIIGKGVSVITDPYNAKKTGLKNIRPKADVVTISSKSDENISEGLVKDYHLLIDRPGEYETKGVMVKGIQSFHDGQKGKKLGVNVMYTIEVDNIIIAHLGNLGHDLSDKQVEALGEVDVLLVPVGGNGSIEGKMAAKVTNEIEPGIVIPMSYKVKGLKVKNEGPEKFTKEFGVKPANGESKISIKKKDIPEDDTKAVLLKPE